MAVQSRFDLTSLTEKYPLVADLAAARESSWFNPALQPAARGLGASGITRAEVDAAAARLDRFAPYLAQVFPATKAAAGRIESALRCAPALQALLGRHFGKELPGRLLLKLDSDLPVSGSIKARGGIYEVLKHAEELALAAGLLRLEDNYAALDSPAVKGFFGRHKIVVGSTGNLGLSIGIMGAQLGFQVDVHMSADARQWKKDALRARGVHVVEHTGDYSAAVAQGRADAEADPMAYFIDDESSRTLFLGYAVAARRLADQLAVRHIVVDARHPLFVYLPCGVGGGPGGVSFGLKTVFGDAVHCVFAEPTHAPCMYLGVYTGLHEAISVQDVGLDGVTAADGLAVSRPSAFVGRTMAPLLDGYYTVTDDNLFRLVALASDVVDARIEPSAAAGIPGPWRVLAAHEYRTQQGLNCSTLGGATHVAWITGGSMVPKEEMAAYIARGAALLGADRPA